MDSSAAQAIDGVGTLLRVGAATAIMTHQTRAQGGAQTNCWQRLQRHRGPAGSMPAHRSHIGAGPPSPAAGHGWLQPAASRARQRILRILLIPF